MMYFAIADLHGRYDLLVSALGHVARYDSMGQGKRVVFLGDYVDRGPDSRKIVAHLMAGPTNGTCWQCLKGNHEQMMVGAWVNWHHGDRSYNRLWRLNGGTQTMASYRQSGQWKNRPGLIPRGHIEWLHRLRAYHRTDTHLFVHAGVDHSLELYQQKEETMLWKLYEDDDLDESFHGLHVVHGHHQHAGGPVLGQNRTNLDTFAWSTGRLVVGVFDDSQGEPVDLIEVTGPTYEMMDGEP